MVECIVLAVHTIHVSRYYYYLNENISTRGVTTYCWLTDDGSGVSFSVFRRLNTHTIIGISISIKNNGMPIPKPMMRPVFSEMNVLWD